MPGAAALAQSESLAPKRTCGPNEWRQIPQGRDLPPTFEKPHEERAYVLYVFSADEMCQVFFMLEGDWRNQRAIRLKRCAVEERKGC
jgi:hypothetical protein